MKRVVFAFVLFSVLIGFNFSCLGYIKKTKNEAIGKLDFLYTSVINEIPEKSASECENFAEYWFSKQHVLCFIVRHDLLDKAALSVSRFSSLAKFGEKSELASEISNCRFIIEEMWDSERPLFRNNF